MSNNNYNPFEDNHYYDDINNPFEDSANNKTAQKLKTFNQNKKYKAKSFLDKGYFKQQKDKTKDSINNYPDTTPVNKQVSKDILNKIPNIKPRIKTPTINVDTDEENGFKVVSIILSLIVLIGTIFGGMFEDSDIFDDNDFIVPDTQLESIYEFYDCIIEDTNYENFDTTPIKNAVNWEDATNISAEDYTVFESYDTSHKIIITYLWKDEIMQKILFIYDNDTLTGIKIAEYDDDSNVTNTWEAGNLYIGKDDNINDYL